MVKISYKIFNDVEGMEGYFQIKIEDVIYGLLLEPELEAFSVSIYSCFSNLLNALIYLKSKEKVYISDIETPKVWLLIESNMDTTTISKIYAEKPNGSNVIETNINLDIEEVEWKKYISLEQLIQEVKISSMQYIEDLKEQIKPAKESIDNLTILLNQL